MAASTLVALVGGVTTVSARDAVGVGGTDLAPDQIGRSANIAALSNTPHLGPFVGQFGTDIAFQGNRAYVGNYQGFVIYDIRNPESPRILSQVNCPGSQNDVTVSGNLLYVSTDSPRSDSSCMSTDGDPTRRSA
ncbi:MAG: hypothetical protein ACRCXL_09920, partial [Dermatophilaceae bacterium]